LIRTPEAAIDAAVVGLWQRAGASGQTESLLVLPLSPREYLVVFPAGSKDAMFARGCFWRNKALTLVQLDWFGTAQAKLPEDNRTFQYLSYAVEGSALKFRLLNPEVVPKDVGSSKALTKAILNNKDNPKLFRDDMVFQKAKN
jgi:hypothetical protein